VLITSGIGRGPDGGKTRKVSVDGHELRFQVNHLAPFLLQHLLLPLLKRRGRDASSCRLGGTDRHRTSAT